MKTILRNSIRGLALPCCIVILSALGFGPGSNPLRAQIYEPEGLNMPGAWDSWTNPPANLALASYTQVPGGRVTKIATGTPRWQTTFSVKATGGDLTAGTYEWLFTSGPTTNYYQNKWAAVTVIPDSLQPYTKEGSTNNSITLVNDKWYTMNWEDLGYVNTRAIFMVTSAEPAVISAVSVPSSVAPAAPAPVTVTLAGPPSIEERFFLRYSTDAWTTSSLLPVVMTGTTGTVDIPGQAAGTIVSYYAFSSTKISPVADFDLITLKLNNNGGTNFSYTVSPPPPVIGFANLQFPGTASITLGQGVDTYGQAYIAGLTGPTGPAAGLEAWIGLHEANTDPATWPEAHWAVMPYFGPSGNNDEFKANQVPVVWGTLYYATRFRLSGGAYVYGGYSATGGGFWDGVTNVSGVLDVIVGTPEHSSTLFRFYPNPAGKTAMLETEKPGIVEIRNLAGILLKQQDVSAGTQALDLSALAPGAYLVKLTSGDRTGRQILIRK